MVRKKETMVIKSEYVTRSKKKESQQNKETIVIKSESQRSKETMMVKSDYLTRSKKKKLEESQKNPFARIHVDLIIEVLMKLPVKSIAMLAFVSKPLESIIRDKYFTDQYMARSSALPRLLFRAHRDDSHMFQSCSQEDPSYDHHHHEGVKSGLNPNLRYVFSPPIRGLICGRNESNVLVGNPSTCQFITLPSVRTTRKGILTFFGYDHVDDVYKVLCLTVKKVNKDRALAEEHQVFSVGDKEKAWRMVKCKHPHRLPHEVKGVFVNGVVYYYAYVKRVKSEGSIISFNLNSEEFNVIRLPEDLRFVDEFSYDLVNYNGNVALASTCFYDKLDMWILDACKQEWSNASVDVPSWRDLIGVDIFYLRGSLSTGELIYETCSSMNPFYLLCYNIKDKSARKVVIQGIADSSDDIDILFDHVESPILLS